MKIAIIILILLAPSFVFASTIDEGENVISKIQENVISKPWQGITWLFNKIKSEIVKFFTRIKMLFKGEVVENEPEIKNEFQKESKEILGWFPERVKSIWNRIKAVFN